MNARQLIESTAEDAEYLQAVEAGDMETCQRMVAATERRAGYPVGPVFHKSPSKFTVFNTSACEGAHFGTEDQAHNLRQRGNRKAGAYYLAIQNPLRLPDLGGWSKFDNLRSHLSRKRIITDSEADEAWDAWQMSDGHGWATLKNIIRRHGFDGIVYANEVEGEGDSYLAFDANQIKSASPVVRKGARSVPLSARFNPASADIRESYLTERGGQKAQISQEMRDAFQTAQAMAHAGHNNDYIQAVTGWYVDKYDKRLRFEVPDNEARLRPPASKSWFNAACDAQATIDKLNKEEVYDGVPRQEAAECLTKYFALFSGPFDRFENQAMSAALRQRDMSLLPEPHDIRSSGGAATLSQVLDHPKLFTAYPGITSVRIETIDPESESRYRGFMRYGTGGEPATIGIVTGRGADATKRTLMHEIQHWIQDYEGFASGASVETMARLGHELDATRERNAAKPWPDDVMARGLVAKLTDADKDKLRSTMADLAEMYATDEELLFDGMRSLDSLPPLEFEGVSPDEQVAMKRLRDKTRTSREQQQSVSTKVKSPELAYHRAAGEIEARDVADRSTMDADAQKSLAPYSFENIAPEDAFVMFGRGPKEWAKSIVSQ